MRAVHSCNSCFVLFLFFFKIDNISVSYSCEDVRVPLQCWGVEETSNTGGGTGDDFDNAGNANSQSGCNLWSIAEDCRGQFSFNPLANFLDPCG